MRTLGAEARPKHPVQHCRIRKIVGHYETFGFGMTGFNDPKFHAPQIQADHLPDGRFILGHKEVPFQHAIARPIKLEDVSIAQERYMTVTMM